MHTTHTTRSQPQDGSCVYHEKNAKEMQLEINHLKRSLHHEWRKQAPSNSDFYSNNEEDGSYKCRSRTLPSESFSYDEDYHHHHKRGNRNSPSKGLGNDAMSRALNQISKSPFTRKVKGGRHPR